MSLSPRSIALQGLVAAGALAIAVQGLAPVSAPPPPPPPPDAVGGAGMQVSARAQWQERKAERKAEREEDTASLRREEEEMLEAVIKKFLEVAP